MTASVYNSVAISEGLSGTTLKDMLTAPVGFETKYTRVKVLCLTTWRRGYMWRYIGNVTFRR